MRGNLALKREKQKLFQGWRDSSEGKVLAMLNLSSIPVFDAMPCTCNLSTMREEDPQGWFSEKFHLNSQHWEQLTKTPISDTQIPLSLAHIRTFTIKYQQYVVTPGDYNETKQGWGMIVNIVRMFKSFQWKQNIWNWIQLNLYISLSVLRKHREQCFTLSLSTEILQFVDLMSSKAQILLPSISSEKHIKTI